MVWQDRDYYRDGGQAWGPTSVTLWMIGISCVFFVAQRVFTGSERMPWVNLGDWMYFSVQAGFGRGQLWRLVTYLFISGDILSFLFNMVALYFFGPVVEHTWGARRFLAFYLLSGIGGALIFSLFTFAPRFVGVSPQFPLIGATTSIFAIVVACAAMYPKQSVTLLIPPIPMTMRTMALIFLGISVVMVLVGSMGAAAEIANLGAAGLGYLFVRQPWLLGFADGISFGFFSRFRQGLRRRRQIVRQRRVDDEHAEVDRILEKVRAHGLQSLSRGEKRSLQRATERQRQSG